jgi:hypothetical protein
MIEDRPITVILHPGRPVEARIVTLTPQLVDMRMAGAWWDDRSLEAPLKANPIDLHWDWNKAEIEFEDRKLRSEKVAVITGEGENLAVQGAMLVSTDPVPSGLDPGEKCLLVELLFTAPRNRPDLRRDGQPFVIGVGSQLIAWGAWLSREKQLEGRLRLDASPDFIRWYEKRKLDVDPIVYEGVAYTPMELPPSAARELLLGWE